MARLRRRPAVLVAALLLLLIAPPAPLAGVRAAHSEPRRPEHALATVLPPGVPAGEERRGWEAIDGVVESGDTVYQYAFWVNPRFKGIYQITHYRISRADHSAEETEKLVWNEAPDMRRPLHVFELVDGTWRRIPSPGPLYDREIFNVIRIYEVHRIARGGGGFVG